MPCINRASCPPPDEKECPRCSGDGYIIEMGSDCIDASIDDCPQCKDTGKVCPTCGGYGGWEINGDTWIPCLDCNGKDVVNDTDCGEEEK